VKTNTGKIVYRENRKNMWRKLFKSEEEFEAFRSKILVSPKEYSEHTFQVTDGKAIKYNAKVHHKIILSGPSVTLGTTFNVTENALNNNEQIAIFTNDKTATDMTTPTTAPPMGGGGSMKWPSRRLTSARACILNGV